MSPLLGLILLSPPSFNADLNRSIRALRATTQVYAKIDYRARFQLLDQGKVTVYIQRPATTFVHIQLPDENGHGVLDWTYTTDGKKLIGYDAVRNVYTERQLPLAKLNMNAYIQLVGSIPEAAQGLLDPPTFEKHVTPLSGLKGWTRSMVGPDIRWTYSTKGTVIYEVDGKSWLPKRLKLTTTSGSQDWTFQYLPLTSRPKLTIPHSARRVPAMTQPPSSPAYEDRDARRVAAKAIHAYEAIRDVTVKRTYGLEKSVIRRRGTNVRVTSSTHDWSFVDNQLTIADRKSGRIYRGRARAADVSTYLARLGMQLDPLAASFLNDGNFASQFFVGEYVAKLVGTVGSGAETKSLIQLFGDSIKLDLSVDVRGRIVSIASYSMRDGKVQPSSGTLTYAYQSGAGSLRVPGTVTSPLPRKR